jgi:putative Holliday junction resolvase
MKLAEMLKSARGGYEVVLWDERLSTVSAIGVLNATNTRGGKRKAVIDAVAAEIILQSYLDFYKGGHENE